MMAWTPVSEAAAALGVSERTIWRRIKADSIPTKSEQGRTFVGIDPEELESDSVRHLSHVAAAQLSMRKLDADTLGEMLDVIRDFRELLQAQHKRARRSARFATVMCVLALAGAGLLGWYHLQTTQRMTTDQGKALADLRAEHDQSIINLREQAAAQTAAAQARLEEVQNLRQQHAAQTEQLAALESSRSAIQAQMDARLAEMQTSVVQDKAMLVERDAQLGRLRATVDELQQELQLVDRRHAELRNADQQMLAAMRRSAAHSRGMAEGLRIHVENQARIEQQLRRELATARAGVINQVSPPADPHDEAVRKAIWSTMLSDDQPVEKGPVGWNFIMRRCLESWMTGNTDTDPAPAQLASASDRN